MFYLSWKGIWKGTCELKPGWVSRLFCSKLYHSACCRPCCSSSGASWSSGSQRQDSWVNGASSLSSDFGDFSMSSLIFFLLSSAPSTHVLQLVISNRCFVLRTVWNTQVHKDCPKQAHNFSACTGFEICGKLLFLEFLTFCQFCLGITKSFMFFPLNSLLFSCWFFFPKREKCSVEMK